MTAFADDDELRVLVGGMFNLALADPEIGPRLRATGAVIRLRCTGPDSCITVDLPNGQVDAGPTAEPTVTITAPSDLVNQMWQGKVNLMTAIATRKITVDGAITALIGLVPVMDQLYPRYVALLARSGRGDLIAT